MSGRKRKSIASRSLSQLQYSSKAEEIASNVDLLTEILLRLPALSVLRFKCVAKQWHSIISDPKFAPNHTRLNAAPTVSGLFLRPSLLDPGVTNLTPLSFDSNINLPTFSFLDFLGSHVNCLDSCNGLFLCSFDEERGRKETYVICNPTTKSYKLLPGSPASSYRPRLAYFPSKSLYKIVTLAYPMSVYGIIEFRIFSSDTNSWKRVDASIGELSTGALPYRNQTVYWDEAIHWMDGETEAVHFRFDVNEEKLEAIQLPPQPKILGCRKIRYFGECGGRLFLIQAREDTASGFRVLEMGKGCSGWTVKFRFNLRSAFHEDKGRLMISDFSILCVTAGGKGNDNEEAEIVVAGSRRVVSYRFKDKTIKVLSSFPSPRAINEWPYRYVYQFQGSLATL